MKCNGICLPFRNIIICRSAKSKSSRNNFAEMRMHTTAAENNHQIGESLYQKAGIILASPSAASNLIKLSKPKYIMRRKMRRNNGVILAALKVLRNIGASQMAAWRHGGHYCNGKCIVFLLFMFIFIYQSLKSQASMYIINKVCLPGHF